MVAYMPLTRFFSVRLLLGVSVACAGLFLSQISSAEPDVLDRPALVNSRATGAVLLAVTRAGDRLVAAGERGLIVLSDDNGATWRQAKVPVSVSITNLYFPSARMGWAVGHSGVVLTTADGGENWAKQLDGKQAAILALNAAKENGKGSEQDKQRALSDAERFVSDGPDKPFLDVHFYDDQNGMIVGAYGLAFVTSNGGKNWMPVMDRLVNPKASHLYCIATKDNEVFISGEQGVLMRSTDRGTSFTAIATPYAGSYFGVILTKPQGALVFGLRGNAYRSNENYKVWEKVDFGTVNSLTAGTRLSDGTLVVTDEAGNVFASRDEGKTFSQVPQKVRASLTGVIEAKDKRLVLTGVRGISHLDSSEIKK